MRYIPLTCDPDRRLKRVPLADLARFQGDFKSLHADQYAKLKRSIEINGFFAPVFVWAGKNYILDGHQRFNVLEREGWDIEGGVPVVELQVRDEQHAAEITLTLSSTYGKVDSQGLYEFTAEKGVDLREFDVVDLPDLDVAKYLDEYYEDEKPAGDPDEVPEPPAVPVTQAGDLWLLGKHRVLCGDCTDGEQVARLGVQGPATLITDPPYNVAFEYTNETNDAKAALEYKDFSLTWFSLWSGLADRSILTVGCVNLSDWCRWFDVYHVAPWIKLNAMSNGKVANWCTWEPILFIGEGWQRKRSNDVFDFSVGMQKETGDHPCPKPLKLWVELIEQYAADAVLEPFVGSGTTLIAAEETGRVCYGLEIAPQYVDVIVNRWQNHTGQAATLDGDGRTFAEIAAERELTPEPNKKD